ncbi:MFS transporter [Paraburkholderia caballeronis]|uniref:MFS transporter, AAHS family, 4-hydroxybenzoate transporter n=1 Tax=Paraburkholderia caballeronis TaxID=416943 RepID=A0A1H7G6K1_9BURK|nr:MFS transporter [Paraburkholderia caballeronis]PXW24772.1 AAHS family 4-hydroxybenzoate transporter-like MFS transporter [Paraburkholderia caballeronis]PXX00502.1 AAHS family 4-hydroxybenzoate transporter-like MFS transporter [Paraburkholderia caballeronis]RAJ98565.1 AAHS family 4-hydroxybenzoate transporter-like MFS transporter [Paraburkholderia caballeronis]SEE67010.1 MFS transporter, AAHS family, 4-hydroxybenzoate transporter [Paraburkholderia caballeronis]SEK31385.1 MFS transporter, AAH
MNPTATNVATVDVTALIERQKLGGFAAGLIAWCFLIVLIDGYDQVAAAFSAPALIRAWHADAATFGRVFGIGLFGVLVGSLLLGFSGDRFGRRLTIIYGSLWFGLLTLACGYATSIEQLTVLRFLAGIGMGGVVPNTVALVSEYAPKARRATWITLMFSGFSIGAGGGGAVASWLLPRFGWPVLFGVGGAAAIVVALASFALLPESIRFLILNGGATPRIARIAKRLGARVDTDAPEHAVRYVVDDEVRVRASPAALFGSGLAYVTPLLWALFVLNSLALHFLQNWLPILFGMNLLAPARAAQVAMMFPVGGTVGALALSRCVDRYGIAVILLLAVVGCPVAASLGMAMPLPWLFAAVFVSGVCVIGSQFALYAVAGIVYPTALRSAGVGSAIGIGKLGSVVGSMLGGVLLAMHLPLATLFANVSTVFVFIALLVVLLGWSRRRAVRRAAAV